VSPEDLTATALYCLGLDPAAELTDQQGRPLAASRGAVLRGIL
jgi:hypothetical protein